MRWLLRCAGEARLGHDIKVDAGDGGGVDRFGLLVFLFLTLCFAEFRGGLLGFFFLPRETHLGGAFGGFCGAAQQDGLEADAEVHAPYCSAFELGLRSER